MTVTEKQKTKCDLPVLHVESLYVIHFNSTIACLAGVKREGGGEGRGERRATGGWEERRTACNKNPFVFNSTAAGGHKIAIG